MRPAKVALLIKSDSSAAIPVLPNNGKKFGLEEVQKVVGGYVEVVRLPHNMKMLVNEEGILMKLPLNLLASQMANQKIVGDVIVVPKGMGW